MKKNNKRTQIRRGDIWMRFDVQILIYRERDGKYTLSIDDREDITVSKEQALSLINGGEGLEPCQIWGNCGSKRQRRES